jgi:hypothetical protein
MGTKQSIDHHLLLLLQDINATKTRGKKSLTDDDDDARDNSHSKVKQPKQSRLNQREFGNIPPESERQHHEEVSV